MRLTPLALLCSALLLPSAADAADCTLLLSYPDSKVLHESGDCDTRREPASTFKLPLAVMGFDSGLLKDAQTPSVPYKDEYASDMDIQKKTTDPTIWLKDSIVWYSQWLTRQMGADTFKAYVDAFGYGNRDVSGTPGKDDGLTHSWLGSSLQISPREQAGFVVKLLNCDLGVAKEACAKTIAVTPDFPAGEWSVHGKTGTSWMRGRDGAYDRTQPLGWFVGWADKGDQKIVFAKRITGTEKWDEYGGPKARDAFLKELPGLLAR